MVKDTRERVNIGSCLQVLFTWSEYVRKSNEYLPTKELNKNQQTHSDQLNMFVQLLDELVEYRRNDDHLNGDLIKDDITSLTLSKDNPGNNKLIEVKKLFNKIPFTVQDEAESCYLFRDLLQQIYTLLFMAD